MINWFLTKVPKQFNGGNNILFKNGPGTARCAYAKEQNWTPTSYHTQKVVKTDWKPNVKAKTIKFLEENTGVNLCDLALGSPLIYDTKATSINNNKNSYTGFHQD